jgi:predicted transcriptional regulator
MNYQNENLNDKIRIKYWATIYGLHLEKWLIMENFTGSKTIVNYEKLKNDLEKEFWKICQFFNEELDVSQLNQISQKISKEEVKKKTPHDKKVINRNGNYEQFRRNFIESNHDYIWKNIKKINSNLINFFNE